ncbi:MAG: YfhO family protein [Clostridiales bacterium]|nr:YfhO family protein [Clostridiales bacterium]
MRKSPRGLYTLAFFIPALLLGIAFALHGVYPFGDRQILVTDLWQQYYPFLASLCRKLRAGESLLYSWDIGMGINYIALAAYYLASPLNLLLALLPETMLREGVTLLLLVRVGLAGVTITALLQEIEPRDDRLPAVFGAMFALCAFILGYYWNIIWLDAFALMPLVMLGLLRLTRSGKWTLYTFALGLCVFTNYYIGYGVCLFTLLAFVCLCIIQKHTGKFLLRRFLLFAGSSVLALGMTAVLTLPAFFALRNAYSSFHAFPSPPGLYESFPNLLANLLSFSPPTDKVGLPNIASSLLCTLLLIPYMFRKDVTLREKLCAGGMLLLLILSLNLNILNFVWHAFHITNMIPYRFAYLVPFTLILIAYRAMNTPDSLDRRALPGMLLTGAALCALGYLARRSLPILLANAALTVAFTGICALPRTRTKSLVPILLVVLITAELGVNAWIGVKTVRTTDRAAYPDNYNNVRALLNRADEADSDTRTAFTGRFTYNDPTLYGCTGIDLFSSSADVCVTRFLEGLGLPAWDAGNRYGYQESSPFTDAVLGIRRLISRDGIVRDALTRESSGFAGNVVLYQTVGTSLGFVTADTALAYVPDGETPFENQNRLFRLMTGLDEDLFTPLDIIHVKHEGYTVCRLDYGSYSFQPVAGVESCSLKWNYRLPQDATLYAYTDIDHIRYIHVLDGTESWYYEQTRPYIYPMGTFSAGDLVSLYSNINPGLAGYATVRVCMLNRDVLEHGLAILARSPFTVTSRTGSSLTGTVDTAVDGLLYLSIPYDTGWQIALDGVPVTPETVGGAMCAIRVSAGMHTVTMRYIPKGFLIGAGISGVCLVTVLLCAAVSRARSRKRRLRECAN